MPVTQRIICLNDNGEVIINGVKFKRPSLKLFIPKGVPVRLSKLPCKRRKSENKRKPEKGSRKMFQGEVDMGKGETGFFFETYLFNGRLYYSYIVRRSCFTGNRPCFKLIVPVCNVYIARSLTTS